MAARKTFPKYKQLYREVLERWEIMDREYAQQLARAQMDTETLRAQMELAIGILKSHLIHAPIPEIVYTDQTLEKE